MSGEREYEASGNWGEDSGEEGKRQFLGMPTAGSQSVYRTRWGARIEEQFTEAVESMSDLSRRQKAYYRHWASSYLEYCRKSNIMPEDSQNRKVFLDWLGQKGKISFVIQQADNAIRLLYKTYRLTTDSTCFSSGHVGRSREPRVGPEGREVWRRVLERTGKEVRIRHYSLKTLKTYTHWIRGFAQFLSFRDPDMLMTGDAKAYLEYLAVERRIAASTQNQAFNALLFLFNNVLERELNELADTPRAKKSCNVPVVFSREEVNRVFRFLDYPYDIFAQLLYGCGLRLGEGLNLRVQDLELHLRQITVHRGKGGKSRRLVIPKSLVQGLNDHLAKVRSLFERDLADGSSGVFLPEALERKFPSAAKEWPWYWVFPGKVRTPISPFGMFKRYHLHESLVQKAIRTAVLESNIPKRATAHTFRHSYATHLLQMGVDIRTVKDWMGHEDVKTTQIYTQALHSLRDGPSNPLDWL